MNLCVYVKSTNLLYVWVYDQNLVMEGLELKLILERIRERICTDESSDCGEYSS